MTCQRIVNFTMSQAKRTLSPDLARLGVVGCPAVAPLDVGIFGHGILVEHVIGETCSCHFEKEV